jgi:saccharopine dehydrogenase (NAD+, L-lysine-forming)
MVDGCLRAGVHYLDVTGEIDVFEAVFAKDAEAKARGILLAAGVGFDVVPTDCLAAFLKSKLPDARELELAFATGGLSSPGTTKSSLEGLARGGRLRRGGKLVDAPMARPARVVPFADKPRKAMAIPWGDLSTAYRSTSIPDITVYMAAAPTLIALAPVTRLLAPILRRPSILRALQRQVEKRVPGPTPEQRARSRTELWGRVSNGSASVEATMTVPEGYTFTADAALVAVKRVLAGVAPGALTPSQAFGVDFVTELNGVTLRG